MQKLLLLPLLFVSSLLFAQSTKLHLNDVVPNSSELNQIDPSKEGELTIVSLNMRDMVGRKRSLINFAYLADVLNEADLIVLQEIGAKGYSRSNKEKMDQHVAAFTALFKVYLGENWESTKAIAPTPEDLGMGAEIPVLFYKAKVNSIHVECSWKEYADLGEKRDMGIFDVRLSKGEEVMQFELGTVHTKPDCPERGQQLQLMAEYITSTSTPFIICGDFNWGYKSKRRCEGEYDGEEKLLELEAENTIDIPFGEISYMGNGKDTDYRTNLMIRKTAHFYDQFILSQQLANKYADDCTLTKDCGFVSISESKEFEKEVEKNKKSQLKGAKYLATIVSKIDSCGISKDSLMEKAEQAIDANWKTADEASFIISDHKPIWIQLRPFE